MSREEPLLTSVERANYQSTAVVAIPATSVVAIPESPVLSTAVVAITASYVLSLPNDLIRVIASFLTDKNINKLIAVEWAERRTISEAEFTLDIQKDILNLMAFTYFSRMNKRIHGALRNNIIEPETIGWLNSLSRIYYDDSSFYNRSTCAVQGLCVLKRIPQNDNAVYIANPHYNLTQLLNALYLDKSTFWRCFLLLSSFLSIALLLIFGLKPSLGNAAYTNCSSIDDNQIFQDEGSYYLSSIFSAHCNVTVPCNEIFRNDTIIEVTH